VGQAETGVTMQVVANIVASIARILMVRMTLSPDFAKPSIRAVLNQC